MAQHSFRKKDQVSILRNKGTIKIKDEAVHIDPKLLFQRLVTAGKFNDSLAEVFQYELCSYPPALFENTYSLKSPNKAALADALWKYMPKDMPVPSDNVQYILYGGAQLHRIPWQHGTTYNDICQQYCRYVSSHYGMPTVVFDGYQDGPSTKDGAHRRRAGAYVGTTIHMSGSMVFKGKKEDVLSNTKNKHRFIQLLRDHLE